MYIMICLLSLQDNKAKEQHRDELDWALGRVSYVIVV